MVVAFWYVNWGGSRTFLVGRCKGSVRHGAHTRERSAQHMQRFLRAIAECVVSAGPESLIHTAEGYRVQLGPSGQHRDLTPFMQSLMQHSPLLTFMTSVMKSRQDVMFRGYCGLPEATQLVSGCAVAPRPAPGQP